MPKGNGDLSIKTNAGAALKTELADVSRAEAERSLLRIAVDAVTEPYHHQAAAKKNLETAAAQLTANPAQSPQNIELARKAIIQIEAARQNELDAYKITSGAAKTLGSFSRGKFGLLVAGSIYALDQAKPDSHMLTDAAWGFAKGGAMRETVSKIATGGSGPAMMSLKLGVASRIVDTSLTRTTYLDGKGELTGGSFGSGLLKSAEGAVDPIALGSDVATAGFAHGMFKLAPQQLTGNTFRAMTTMSFTRGFAGGLTDEGQSQYLNGKLDLERLALYPLASALSTSLAAAPGNQRLYARNYSLEKAATIRDREYKLVALAPADVKAIARGGNKVIETTVKPVGEAMAKGEPEKLSISRANVPVDWISAAANAFKRSGKSSSDEIRFVSRPGGDANAPWQLTIDKSASTISQIIARNSNYYQGKDVAPHLKDFKEPVRGFLGSGSESGAFKLSNGAVLKLASSFGSEKLSDWGKLPHDARVMYGPTVMNNLTPGSFRHVTAHSLLLQEPLKTPVKEVQAEALRTQMGKDGVSFHDYNFRIMGDQVSWAVDQVGINAHGKTVMLDYGARRQFNK